MNCPVCDEPMIVLDYDDVEIDYCVSCGGVWLDAGELELLFGEPEACDAFLRAGGTAPAGVEKPRRCPICRKKMGKALTGGEPPVIYDRCDRGDGLWLDRGELATVLGHGRKPDGGQRVTDFLREIFPENKT